MFNLVLNVLILNMNVLGNVNMMHITVRNSLRGGCRLNKEAGDAASLRLCAAWRRPASQSPLCIHGVLTQEADACTGSVIVIQLATT